MRIKLLFKILGILLISFSMQSQDVDLKKEDVFVDGRVYYKFDKRNMSLEFSLYTIDKSEELIYIQRNNNGTTRYHEDDFVQITFIKDNIKLENATLHGRSFKYMVELFLKEKVLNLDGSIDAKKLDTFITKYDEKITERTIRR